ncbi:MAG: putative replication initiation protein [Microviridae sp.]|nr:MAG: putative replication initiation protein [Microviridae sp.]
MCLSPSFVYVQKGPGFVQQPVPCKHCWQCVANRVSDWEGRCLAEKSTSAFTYFVTLTYRDSSERDKDAAHKIITPPHFQNFMKSLRRDGHLIRYLVAAEYGHLKGRAHFHALLFSDTALPEVPHQSNFHWKHWPHGHTYSVNEPDSSVVRYLTKYLQKDKADGESCWFSMSKKPPLGDAYFRQLAARNAALSANPRHFLYAAPGGVSSRDYQMSGTTRRNYFEYFIQERLKNGAGEINFASLNESAQNALVKIQSAAHEKAFWRLSSADRFDALFGNLDSQRPSDRQVLKIFFDTHPNGGLNVDWDAFQRRWQDV